MEFECSQDWKQDINPEFFCGEISWEAASWKTEEYSAG